MVVDPLGVVDALVLVFLGVVPKWGDCCVLKLVRCLMMTLCNYLVVLWCSSMLKGGPFWLFDRRGSCDSSQPLGV